MALQKQVIDIPFTGGVDTKIAEKLLQPGSWARLENLEVTRPGKLTPRYGLRAFSASVEGGATQGRPVGLASAGARLLLQTEGGKHYSFSLADSKWISRVPQHPTGGMPAGYVVQDVRPTAECSYTPVAGGPAEKITQPHVVACNGYYVYAYMKTTRSTAGAYTTAPVYSVQDAASGEFLVVEGEILAAGTVSAMGLGLVALRDEVAFVYYNTRAGVNYLVERRLTMTSPLGALSAARDIYTCGATQSILMWATSRGYPEQEGFGATRLPTPAESGSPKFYDPQGYYVLAGVRYDSAEPVGQKHRALFIGVQQSTLDARTSDVFTLVGTSTPQGCAAVERDERATTGIYTAIFSEGTTLYACRFDPLDTGVSAVDIEATGLTYTLNHGVALSFIDSADPATDGVCLVFFSLEAQVSGLVTSPGFYGKRTYLIHVADALFTDTATLLYGSAGLAGRAFRYGSTCVLPLMFSFPQYRDTGLADAAIVDVPQDTYFLGTGTGHLFATIFPGVTQPDVFTSHTTGTRKLHSTPTIVERSRTEFSALMLVVGEQTATADPSVAGAFLYSPTVGVRRVDFRLEAPLTAALSVDSLVGASGLTLYSPWSMNELGFAHYPYCITAEAIAAGGLPAGDYEVCAVFSFVDANGRLQLSAPSVPVSVTVDAGHPTIRVYIPSLRTNMSLKSPVDILVYRTQAAGSVFRLAGLVRNDPTDLDYQTVDLTVTADPTDEAWNRYPALYTTGGVLENIAPMSASCICEHNNRIFFGGADANNIYYTKTRQDGREIEFNDAQRIVLPTVGGRVTGFASLEGALYIFKESAVLRLYGDGPNDLGVGDFSKPVEVSSNVGAHGQNAIVNLGQQVLFRGASGVWAVAGGGVEYAGVPVEGWNAELTRGAFYDAKRNQVRFYTDSRVLVLDLTSKVWSTHTSGGSSAALWQGTPMVIQRGNVLAENVAPSLDDTLVCTAESPWLKLEGLQGFQRVWWIYLLGNFPLGQRLKVELMNDYEDEVVQSAIFERTDPNEPHELRLHPDVQRCQAVKVRVSTVGKVYDGLELSGLRLELGMKTRRVLPAGVTR